MKIRTWTVSLAVLVAGAANAKADISASEWSYDNNVKGVAFASDCCEPECGAADACCADPCCGSDCGDGCGCGAGVAGFTLASALGLAADSPLVIGGWSQWGYHDANDGTFNTHPHLFQAQQQYLYAGWTADGSDGIGLGGRVDVVYGTDAQNTQAFGNPNGFTPGFGTWDNSLDHGIYGWAIPQAYAEVAVGDLSVKAGHFYTLLGYQVVPATGNFFYSIPYTFNYSEAFTHTGVLGTYTMSDTVTLYGGWTLGWDTGFDQNLGGNSYIGGAAVSVMDSLTVTVISTGGDLGWIGDDGYTHSVVGVLDITDAFQYVFQSDLVDVNNSAATSTDGGPLRGRYDTFGINQYLFYTFNDMFKGGARMEWWKADGVSLYEMAYGINVTPISNVIIRPEIRYNWCPSDTLPFVVNQVENPAAVAGANTFLNEWIAAADLIFTF